MVKINKEKLEEWELRDKLNQLNPSYLRMRLDWIKRNPEFAQYLRDLYISNAAVIGKNVNVMLT